MIWMTEHLSHINVFKDFYVPSTYWSKCILKALLNNSNILVANPIFNGDLNVELFYFNQKEIMW